MVVVVWETAISQHIISKEIPGSVSTAPQMQSLQISRKLINKFSYNPGKNYETVPGIPILTR